MKKVQKNLVFKLSISIVGLIFLASYAYLLFAYFSKPVQMTDEEVSATIASVSKLIKVDSGQEPLVATIQDASALAKEQSFYEPANNGDILVVYQDKAIIYRPDENILVNVGPVFIQNSTFTVDLRNGSGISGATTTLRINLESQKHVVESVSNASNSNYQGIVIVNLNNQNVEALQTALNATVVTELPAGEASTTSDLIIIQGQ